MTLLVRILCGRCGGQCASITRDATSLVLTANERRRMGDDNKLHTMQSEIRILDPRSTAAPPSGPLERLRVGRPAQGLLYRCVKCPRDYAIEERDLAAVLNRFDVSGLPVTWKIRLDIDPPLVE